nr:MAG TPA: hypothetical protein [Caudoviricetes sp.]
MEEVKYIQGDLVKLNGKTVKITFAGHDVIEYIPLDRRGGDEWRTSRKLIEPIKLTPQILEDNGWEQGELKKEDNARAYYYTYSKKGCIVELRYYTLCDMFLVYIGQEALMNTLFLYVHQLQHLLFGLNLPMDLNV